VAILAGGHGVIEIIANGLMDRVPLGRVMVLVARVAGQTTESPCFVNICFRTPLLPLLLAVGTPMAGPAIFVRSFSDDLKMKVFKVGHIFSGVIDGGLFHH
jgi:hypothetical protein